MNNRLVTNGTEIGATDWTSSFAGQIWREEFQRVALRKAFGLSADNANIQTAWKFQAFPPAPRASAGMEVEVTFGLEFLNDDIIDAIYDKLEMVA